MRTIALRFAEIFAPPEGTIGAHDEVIRRVGYVWYGKMGTPLSQKVIESIMEQESLRILLIHSGGIDRYWAYIDDISRKLVNISMDGQVTEEEYENFHKVLRAMNEVSENIKSIKAFINSHEGLRSRFDADLHI